MNKREKIMAGAVGALVAVFVFGFGTRAYILAPLKALDRNIAASKAAFEKISNEKRQYFATEDRVKANALRTFGETIDQASAVSGEILTKRILQGGLEESEFTRLPAATRKLKGANEIGWMVQGEGPLANIVNLLFLLDNSPYLHRIEALAVNNGDTPGRARVRFRFLTLVFEPGPDVERKALADKYTLESPERRIYDDLIARDLLRPYIKRPPPPPVAPGHPAGPGGIAAAATAPGPESFKIVSLSDWDGKPEIHVLDTTAQKTKRYAPGEQLAGGTIVCVDYRELPMAGNLALSESRVILKVGAEFWAIERGKTLADKHKMDVAQLPLEIANAK
jgi:hypothetical protein